MDLVSSSKRQTTIRQCHSILGGPIEEDIIILNVSLLCILWKNKTSILMHKDKNLAHESSLGIEKYVSIKFTWIQEALVEFKEHLPFYLGIWDLCDAYYWQLQNSNEFWTYSSPSRTSCLSKPGSHHHKKKDGTIPCKIFFHKSKNGDNIVVNFCIPLKNSWDMVQHMWNMQISWDVKNDEAHSVL